MVVCMTIEPLFSSDDAGFRIAARYGLNFYLISESTIVEKGEYGDETREPTYPEIRMWYNIVPEYLTRLINEHWFSATMPPMDATPEEVWCAMFAQTLVYFNAHDFVAVRRLKGFDPTTMRARLLLGCVGDFVDPQGHKTEIFVSRQIPQGYYLSVKERIPELGPFVQPYVPGKPTPRIVRPPLPERLVSDIQFKLQCLRQDYDLLTHAGDFLRTSDDP